LDFEGKPGAQTSRDPRENTTAMIKRTFDILLSLLGLIILFPVFLCIIIMIKMEDGGPVFYRGVRVGKHGIPFHIYKFRSMRINAEKIGGSSTSHSDPRITKTGTFVRKYKLDELSQLINVFLGDMSLVGPRPQVKWAVDTYSEDEKKILWIRPGITDWASIKFHNEGEIIEKSGITDPDEAYMKLIHPEKMRLQLQYLRDRSLWIDLKILFQTVATLFITRIPQKTS
jgi:lipopolysaccharide/colanic/teichoic acid biosynthesis glycosyltransferase